MYKLFMIAGVASLTGAAQASFITLFEYDNVAAGYQHNVRLHGASLNLASGRSGIRIALDMTPFGGAVFTRTLYAGVLNLNIEDPLSKLKNRDFMCVEVDQNIQRSNLMYAKFESYGRVGWLIKEMPKYRSNNDAMAGLQLAIWEVAYDTSNGVGDDLSSGIFKVTGGANAATLNWANSFLAASQSGGSGLQKGYFYYKHPVPGATTALDRQDLISVIPGPAAAAPFLIGLVALRRKKK